MTERHRHRPDKKTGKRAEGAPRRRTDSVSLADRLGGSEPGSEPRGAGPGSTTVLPSGSKAAAVKPQSRKQLREQREQQQRQARQRWFITAAAVLGVVVIGALLVVWLAGRGEDTGMSVAVGRTELTLAMTLADDDGAATSGALMVYDVDNESAGSVLIPSRLFVEGPTPGGLPFGDTVQLGDDAAPGTSLADTLDVVVDDTWQVSDDMLTELVDASDGVLVDVDTDVLSGPAGGQQSIVVTAGDGQLLGGKKALAFATYLAPEENEEARLARFSQVLDQVVQRLPADRADLLATLDGVAATDSSTLSLESLADFLLGYGGIGRSGDTSYQTLPVTPLETGGPNPALIVEAEGLERLRAGLLADSLPPDAGGEQITVLVQNGVGTPGLEQDAAELLRDEGYDFFNGGNALEFGREETLILIPDSAPASRALGDDIASTLGVPESAVQVSDQGSSIADVIVILGADFKP
ncbi:MAG: LytR C-terminal domain-containing protein [Actinomycetia bacterium]|nr:LytR C-terminal domain-containing protein [Actinomycetes bacterium]